MGTEHLIDPQVRSLLDVFPHGDPDHRSLPDLRAFDRTRSELLPASICVETLLLPGATEDLKVPLRLLTPASGRTPRALLLHMHGGGFVAGSAAMSDAANAARAIKHDMVVASVDYRLAPERPFPAAIDDCFSALVWLAANAAEIGVDPGRIAVTGESAGGGLAAALAHLARDHGGPSIAAQFLIYPMLDDRTGGQDDDRANAYTGEFIWTRASNRYGWEALRGEGAIAPARIAHFSPALAESLSGLPPCFIATGALDLFFEENVRYATRMARSGVPVELHSYAGAIHGFNFAYASDVAQCFSFDIDNCIRRWIGGGL